MTSGKYRWNKNTIILTYTHTIYCTVFKLLQTIVQFFAFDRGGAMILSWTHSFGVNRLTQDYEIWPQDTRNIPLSYGTSVTDGQINRRTERSLRLVDTNSVKVRKQYTRTSFNWLTTSCFSRSSWAICDSESVSKTWGK